jgi:hypothetical protein
MTESFGYGFWWRRRIKSPNVTKALASFIRVTLWRLAVSSGLRCLAEASLLPKRKTLKTQIASCWPGHAVCAPVQTNAVPEFAACVSMRHLGINHNWDALVAGWLQKLYLSISPFLYLSMDWKGLKIVIFNQSMV